MARIDDGAGIEAAFNELGGRANGAYDRSGRRAPKLQREGTIVKAMKKIHTHGSLKAYTYLGCPLTRNRTPWCFRSCQPDARGHGTCGRQAPHSVKSRIQQAIEDHNNRLSTEPVAVS
jgi:hypothetical protein